MVEQFSLPQREYIVPNVHKYAVGNLVRNTNDASWNKWYNKEGTIVKLLPFGTLYAVYDVQYDDGSIVATSECSIQQLPEFECDVCSAVSSTYISCDGCDWTLCHVCAYDIEGVAYCSECYNECIEGEEDE